MKPSNYSSKRAAVRAAHESGALDEARSQMGLTDDERVAAAIEEAAFGNRVTAEQARTLAAAARPLWLALKKLGMVDGYGGLKCQRVLPAALEFIHNEANRRSVS